MAKLIFIVFGCWILLSSNYSYNSSQNVTLTNSMEPNFEFLTNENNSYFTVKSNKQHVSKNDVDFLIDKIGFNDNKIINLKLILDEKDDGMNLFFKGKGMISCRNIHNMDYCIKMDESGDFICTSLAGGITNVCREYSRGSDQSIINDFRVVFEKTRILKESISLSIGSQMVDSRSGEEFNYIQIWSDPRVETDDLEAVFQILPKKKNQYLFSVNEGIEPNVYKDRNQYYFIYDLLGNKTTVSNDDIHFFKYKK
ncbi:hypothetical protein [Paenibacillus periandrae]|uniref:hypothetical protein n=1 Tax=Paenibacillus periandrae TaxID=1761741 RepID=UPI001F09227C|nr:hypothetical protein [Paenibacillus periandrae]